MEAGTCHEAFVPLRDVFLDNFARRSEVGGAVAVYVDGACLVDLWAGRVVRDQKPSGPWQADTIIRMMSINKAMTALCAHRLADQGLLDYDAPVARYWPDFAQAGKGAITVRQLMSGLAALVYPDEVPAGSAYDWDRVVEGLARQAPNWPPGTRGAYHSSTYGHLVGELVRRVSGRRPSQVFAEEIGRPFGIDYHFRVAPGDRARVSEVLSNPGSTTYSAIARGGETKLGRAWRILPDLDPAARDRPEALGVEMPSGFGRGNARAIGKLFAILGEGGRWEGRTLVSERAIRAMSTLAWDNVCPLTDRSYRYGMGMFLNTPGLVPMGPNPAAFGHPGAGGAIGFCDPRARLAFSYCTAFMCEGAGVGERCEALIRAAFEGLSRFRGGRA
ncbi:serine hydrolase [Methylobacterium currus]|uniref:Serine hydrolase n=1 Tax=Methylobacterium currus TaxID=2051553 RepID=A0A2R4WWY6_9HYPH|nr:serine hydrolase [Methylobacterium currus]